MARRIGGRIGQIRKGDAANYGTAADFADPARQIAHHLNEAHRFLDKNTSNKRRNLQSAIELLEKTITLTAEQEVKLTGEIHHLLVTWFAMETERSSLRTQELQTIKGFAKRTGFEDIERAVDKILNPNKDEAAPMVSSNEASQKQRVFRDPQSAEEASEMAVEYFDAAQALLIEARRVLELGLMKAQYSLDVKTCKEMRAFLAEINRHINPPAPAAKTPESPAL